MDDMLQKECGGSDARLCCLSRLASLSFRVTASGFLSHKPWHCEVVRSPQCTWKVANYWSIELTFPGWTAKLIRLKNFFSSPLLLHFWPNFKTPHQVPTAFDCPNIFFVPLPSPKQVPLLLSTIPLPSAGQQVLTFAVANFDSDFSFSITIALLIVPQALNFYLLQNPIVMLLPCKFLIFPTVSVRCTLLTPQSRVTKPNNSPLSTIYLN